MAAHGTINEQQSYSNEQQQKILLHPLQFQTPSLGGNNNKRMMTIQQNHIVGPEGSTTGY
jgi:hypothetical protein